MPLLRAVLQQNPWDLPSLSTTSQLPSQHIPGNLLRFLLHPGTLKQKLGDASQKPRAPPFPLFARLGFFLCSRGVHSSHHLPQTGNWDSWSAPGSISRKTISGPGPIPRVLPMPLETLLLRGEFFPDWRLAAPGTEPSRAQEPSRCCCPLQVTLVARWGCSSGPASSPSSSSSITCTR